MRIHFKYLLLVNIILFVQDAFAVVDNIYANTKANMFSPAVSQALYRVYVPNGADGTVSVINPYLYQVVDTFPTGKEPQHVVPSYDLKTLWVLNNNSNSVTPIDPLTGRPGANIHVDDPYNLYFTPDGKYAIDVCEANQQLEFRDPISMKLISTIHSTCGGANHMEFAADGQYAIVTCEYTGKLMKIDLQKHAVVGYLVLNDPPPPPAPPKPAFTSEFTITTEGKVMTPTMQTHHDNGMTSMPQDIRSRADGKLFFVADMMKDGLFVIDPDRFVKVGFIPTGIGAHAIYPSRDGTVFYVSNRGCHHMSHCAPHGPGNITVVDPIKEAVIATWHIPQGGSPDMGNVTGDGSELWVSGRYDKEVYVFDTTSGVLTHRIPVGGGPHGLTVWPQPGRYSLGHTGNMR